MGITGVLYGLTQSPYLVGIARVTIWLMGLLIYLLSPLDPLSTSDRPEEPTVSELA